VVRALPRAAARRRRGGRRARQLAHRDRVVVVRGSVPEVEIGVPQVRRERPGRSELPLRQRGQHHRVGRRRHRTVPGEVRAVGTAPPRRGAGRDGPQGGSQVPRRRGDPRPGRGEPDRAAEEVDGEVGGELDRRLELDVQLPVHGGGASGRRRSRGRHRRHGDRPAGSTAQAVGPQRGRPPGEVGAVGTCAPAGQPPAERVPPGRGRVGGRCGGRGARRARRGSRSGLDTQHSDRQAHRQADRHVRGTDRGRRTRHGSGQGDRQGGGGARSEQADLSGDTGSRHRGPPDRCRLDRHVSPPGEVVAAAGEGTAGKEEPTDGDARRPPPGTPPSGRVTEPLSHPLQQVDDPPAPPVTCRHPGAKGQLSPRMSGR